MSSTLQAFRRITRDRKINAEQAHAIVFVVDGESNHTKLRPDNLPLKDIAFVLEQFAIAIQAESSMRWRSEMDHYSRQKLVQR